MGLMVLPILDKLENEYDAILIMTGMMGTLKAMTCHIINHLHAQDMHELADEMKVADEHITNAFAKLIAEQIHGGANQNWHLN